MGRWAQLLKLLLGEDINGDQVDLGVSVLAGLGGRHVDDLAWAVLDADEAVLSQGRTLHWVGGGRAGIGRVEGVLMLKRYVSIHMFTYCILKSMVLSSSKTESCAALRTSRCCQRRGTRRCGVKECFKERVQSCEILPGHRCCRPF